MEKRKIAIVTIYTIPNYGSILQAFALQSYLNKLNGFAEVDIINYDYRGIIHRLKRSKVIGFIRFLKNEYSYYFRRVPEVRKRKLNKFLEFRNLFIKETRCFKNSWALKHSKELRNYDVFITGSDQVWNTKELQGDLTFLLDFVPKGKQKLSFSSSFGIDYVDNRYKSSFIKLFHEYQAISVREKDGIRILKDLDVQCPCFLTCDPTLLLDSSDYDSLASRSSAKIDFPYILVYGLSYAFNPMPAILEAIVAAVNEYKCKVVFLTKEDIPFDGDCEYILDAGPCDFIKYIANAKYVVTSSFHGTLFSIIYRKPFTPIGPKNGDTRIADVLETLGISEVLLEPYNTNVKLTNDSIYNLQFESRLKQYIEYSQIFLTKNIK